MTKDNVYRKPSVATAVFVSKIELLFLSIEDSLLNFLDEDINLASLALP